MDATPSRLGQVNNAGDNLALFLKVASGEVLEAFKRAAYFRDKHQVRTINSGKSAQFPATGFIQARLHQPGVEILGQQINNAERVINIEGLIIADGSIASIDEAMNYYDYRSVMNSAIALALSKQYDQDVSRTVMNAARSTAVVNGLQNGTVEVNQLFATDGGALYNGIYDGGVTLDTHDVPDTDRYATVRPIQYALIVKDGRAVDIRYNSDRKDLGGFAEGVVKMINGIPIGKTNNYFSGDSRADALQPASRQHDYSTSQFLIHHKSAAGTVALRDMQMEAEWDMRRQVYLTLGKYLCGHDVLRAEAAFEGQSAAPAG